MIKINIFTVALLISAFSTLNAATYKGQKVYIDSCKDCHGGGQAMAGGKNTRTWEKIMDKKGEQLASIHLNSKKAQPSWEYFQDKKFTKDAKHLEDFLTEYSRDSGNVPACN
ncbi:MAG: cytochrome C [Sulfuricurvum sp.]|uniref:cytochrome C n=1 Tax=Sulfuricurvum sp. TaxID=2025608 RepID=UPI00260ECBEC|nr:cytochrome C [Sulfuricurvum sp.]MDD2828816.1 cytochrome C [Sulfuricurvum sp.]MDD4948725.1 cytochrome C [Sulfuricurvum sp.]